MIEAHRVASAPELHRIVVGVDPAVSLGEDANATGIIVAGLGANRNAYVLEDCSGKYSPQEWALKAVAAFKRHKADRIVAEANQGGLMVQSTLRAIDANLPIRLVHASRGKLTRAEPISALYEQNRVYHVGAFPLLEDEMCSFEAGSPNSPDRLDALVWALTEIGLKPGMMPITDEMLRLAAMPGPDTRRNQPLDHPMFLGRGSRIMQASDFNPRWGGPPAPTWQRPAIDLNEQACNPNARNDPTVKR